MAHAVEVAPVSWRPPLLFHLSVLFLSDSLLKLAVSQVHVPGVMEVPAASVLLVMLALVFDSAAQQQFTAEALMIAVAMLVGPIISGTGRPREENDEKKSGKPSWLSWRSVASPTALGTVLWFRFLVYTSAGVSEVAFGWAALAASLALWIPAQKWPADGEALGEELVACLVAFERGKLPREACLEQAAKLLEGGADPNKLDFKTKRPCLQVAASCLYELSPQLVELLLRRGANPNAGCQPTQKTALMEACDAAKVAQQAKKEAWRETFEAVVGKLVEAGAQVDQRDVYGDTALALMAHDGRKELCDILVAGGANPRLASEVSGSGAAYWYRRRGWELPGSGGAAADAAADAEGLATILGD